MVVQKLHTSMLAASVEKIVAKQFILLCGCFAKTAILSTENQTLKTARTKNDGAVAKKNAGKCANIVDVRFLLR